MVGITKKFPGVIALDNVNLGVRKGSVHAIVGENGAGKSTLMKILSGIYTPDSGSILIEGGKVDIRNPLDALSLGISIIQQELVTIPELTIAQNFFLGREPTIHFSWLVDYERMNDEAARILKEFHIGLNPKTKMKDLSIAQIQIVEIAKAVSTRAQIIIMDEPTSAITDDEVDNLFRMINDLTSSGAAVIYISHKIEEILKISDEITILRDGKYIGSWLMDEIDTNSIIKLMVGRDLKQRYPKRKVTLKDEILSIHNLTRKGKFSDINFSIRAGEILGVAGLMGSGRTEIMRAIFGLDKLDSGEIYLHGQKVNITCPSDAIYHKIAMVTEDRRKYGVILKGSVRQNISLVYLKLFIKLIIVNQKKEKETVTEFYNKFSIKSPSLDTRVEFLSGGNQQKVVLAKWMLSKPDVLILDEPTRGIDVGAKYELYRFITNLAQEGIAIILVSSELPELLGMADRILVMCHGKMTALLNCEQANQENIMKYAIGV